MLLIDTEPFIIARTRTSPGNSNPLWKSFQRIGSYGYVRVEVVFIQCIKSILTFSPIAWIVMRSAGEPHNNTFTVSGREGTRWHVFFLKCALKNHIYVHCRTKCYWSDLYMMIIQSLLYVVDMSSDERPLKDNLDTDPMLAAYGASQSAMIERPDLTFGNY